MCAYSEEPAAMILSKGEIVCTYPHVYVGLPSRPAPISANAPIKNPFVDPGLRLLVRGCSRSSRPRRLAQLGCVTSRRSAEGRRATLRERMCKVV